jgi:hypothetical protein
MRLPIRRTIGPPPLHVIETEIRGDISLYDAQNERVLVLNGTASDVWRLCDGEQTLDEIVALLAKAYQIQPDAIRDDVTRTIRQLIDEGFLDGEATRLT